MTPTACPAPESWRAWLADAVPAADARAFDAHLEYCLTCRATLDGLTDSFAWSWLSQVATIPEVDAPPPTVPGYELLDEVGRGGHGVVYRAIQRGLGRTVALKCLRRGTGASVDERNRFQAEAESLARLRHPNVVPVFEAGTADGAPYLVMEWHAGGSLADKLDGTPWPATEAARLVAQLADAVACAHAAGVVHRDLKPANVLLGEDGTPRLTDFGLAKCLDAPSGHTPSVAILGTPGYMAPEQAVGDSRNVGPVTDVYGLAAVLYELLTGRPPFAAATMFDTLLLVRNADPVAPRLLNPKVPRDLETICLTALHKAPARRYATAGAFGDDLRRFLDGRPVVARRAGLVERAVKWLRRHPGRVIALAALFAVGLATAIGVAAARSHSSEAAARARAATLLRAILTAEPDAVPALVGEFEPLRHLTAADLESLAAAALPGSRESLNASVALLPVDPWQAAKLVDRVPGATPEEVLLIRTALGGGTTDLAPLWSALADSERPAAERFRAACVLAGLAEADDPRWSAHASAVAGWLAAENPLRIGRWTDLLEPVKRHLTEPLRTLAIDSKVPEVDRVTAAGVLAKYQADQPVPLAELYLDVEPRAARELLPALKAHAAAVAPRLQAELTVLPPPTAHEVVKDQFARRHVAAAAGLWHCGNAAPVAELFGQQGTDVRRRYYLIHRAAALGVGADFVCGQLLATSDATTRRSLLLALGEYDVAAFSALRRNELRPALERMFRDDPDSGVHAAVEWLVRRAWGHSDWLAAAEREFAGKAPTGRRWMVAPSGATMAAIVGPVEFQFGSAKDEPHHEGEALSRHVIRHRFALATREVTVAEFARFLKAYPGAKYEPPSPDDGQPPLPIRRTTLYVAMQYCRWLCEVEGLPESEMPYPPIDQIRAGMVFPPRFLTRTGYRLPTEEEWECAVRAGTETPRFFGYDFDVLYKYAWCLANSNDSCHEGATLRPNDRGLFDVYGNVWEWTQPTPYDEVAGRPGLFAVKHLAEPYAPVFHPEAFPAIARGGSYLYHAPFVRSAKRYMLAPTGDTTIGFRIARTLPAKD